MAKLLVEEGIDIQAASIDGKTAIHYATQFGQEDVVHFLLQCNAKDLVNQADGSGWIPLHYAAEQGCLPLMESFLQACYFEPCFIHLPLGSKNDVQTSLIVLMNLLGL